MLINPGILSLRSEFVEILFHCLQQWWATCGPRATFGPPATNLRPTDNEIPPLAHCEPKVAHHWFRSAVFKYCVTCYTPTSVLSHPRNDPWNVNNGIICTNYDYNIKFCKVSTEYTEDSVSVTVSLELTTRVQQVFAICFSLLYPFSVYFSRRFHG